jgi:predicted nucleic acid-binding protein
MPSSNILVLDANILIRAVLGKKVRELLFKHCDEVEFFTPDVCMDDAKKYLPILFKKRSLPYEPAVEVLFHLESLLNVVGCDIYHEREEDAKKRIKSRDLNDWPIIATALTLNCPVRTEDQDFFGTGISVWTTNRIHIFFEDLS